MQRAICGSIVFIFASFCAAACRPQAPSMAACSAASDCASWEACLEGVCKRVQSEPGVDRCAGVQCPSATWCERATGTCHTGQQPCDTSLDCTGEKRSCDRLFGVCRECTLDDDCISGWTCDRGACVNRRPECSSDQGCRPPSTICTQTQCTPGCGTDGCAANETCDLESGRCADGASCTERGCPNGESCDTTSGACQVSGLGATCTNDQGCPGPRAICESGVCAPGCMENGGPFCGTDRICDPSSGRCIAPPACATAADCPVTAPLCDDRRCRPGCDQSGGPTCPSDQACNPATGRCAEDRCTDDSACSAPTPLCNESTGACFACASNAACSDPTPTCDLATGACYGCRADSDCGGPTPICLEQLGVCVECESSASCGGSTPICDAAAGECVACLANDQCSGTAPVCDNAAHICRACASDSDCGGEVCDTGSGRCVACAYDADCAAPAPLCNRSAGRCEGCTASDCTGSTPTCDATSGECRRCNANADCSGATPTCHLPSGACVGCVSSADCGGSTPVCDAQQGICRGCTGNAQCGATTPVCHLPSGLCLECVSNSDCAAPEPICAPASGTCGGCAATGCPGNTVCNASSGACESPLGSLGATCASDAACASDLCFDLGGAIGRRCTRSCEAPSDCDNGTTCYMVNGARMCLSAANTPSFAQAIDCTRDADCSSGICTWVQVSSGRWDHRCGNPVGSGAGQSQCTTDSDCRSGLCSVSVNNPNIGYCRYACVIDSDCPQSFSCVYVEWGSQSYVQAAKVCLPVPTLSPATCQRDAHCGAGEQCKILGVQGPRSGVTYLANSCLP